MKRLVKAGSHQADVALIRNVCEWIGLTNVVYDREIRADIRPDLVMQDAGGRRIAVEVERHVKCKARYAEKLKSLWWGQRLGFWHEVIYLVPDERVAVSLRRIFKAMGREMAVEVYG